MTLGWLCLRSSFLCIMNTSPDIGSACSTFDSQNRLMKRLKTDYFTNSRNHSSSQRNYRPRSSTALVSVHSDVIKQDVLKKDFKGGTFRTEEKLKVVVHSPLLACYVASASPATK